MTGVAERRRGTGGRFAVERTRFLKTLVDTARSLDRSRLISAAMEVYGDKTPTCASWTIPLASSPTW
jgi:hypothetical protein